MSKNSDNSKNYKSSMVKIMIIRIRAIVIGKSIAAIKPRMT